MRSNARPTGRGGEGRAPGSRRWGGWSPAVDHSGQGEFEAPTRDPSHRVRLPEIALTDVGGRGYTSGNAAYPSEVSISPDEGIVELVAWSGDGRSIVVSLRGREVAGYDVGGWQCTIELATGRVSLTDAQEKANAGTFENPSSAHYAEQGTAGAACRRHP